MNRKNEPGRAGMRALPWICASVGVTAAAVGAFAFSGQIFGGAKLRDATGVTVSDSSLGALISGAEYPSMPQYPGDDGDHRSWNEALNKLGDQPEGYSDGTDRFFSESIRTVLSGAGSGNRVYSPLGLFMALGMSAEITDGNTRRQILDLLGQDSIESMRSHARSVWEASYIDDGMAKCVLANSVWLNSSFPFSRDTMNRLSDEYYAYSFTGRPGSEEYDKLLRGWISKQTDGLLDSCTDGIKLDPQSVIAIVSTVNYAGKWNNRFSPDKTADSVFHAPSGDIICPFMNMRDDMEYIRGDRFAALELRLENNGMMRLILPDEGVSPEDLLGDDQTMDYLTSDFYPYKKRNTWESRKYADVSLSLPKFDVSSDTDLKEALNKLGITDVFDDAVSDFSLLATDADPTGDSIKKGISLSEARQAVRVEIDEEGCRAAALTIMMYCGAAATEDRVEMIYDRPFIFEIVGRSELPLFVGIVNSPK